MIKSEKQLNIGIRLTKLERDKIKKAATKENFRNVSTWARKALLDRSLQILESNPQPANNA